MGDNDSQSGHSRRTVLKSATIGASSATLLGAATADDHNPENDPRYDEDKGGPAEDYDGKGTSCGYENPGFGPGHQYPEHHVACSGDHPEAKMLKKACEYSLTYLYPDLGTMISQGYIGYFDNAIPGGFSHWLNPDYINDGAMLDPGRPETILVDNRTRCPMGIMFQPHDQRKDTEPMIYAEFDPDKIDPSHTDVYGHSNWEYSDALGNEQLTDNNWYASEEIGYHDRHIEWEEEWYGSSDTQHSSSHVTEITENYDEDDYVICAPWHNHRDFLARGAWWYYRQAYDKAAIEEDETKMWCVTPAMLHVWPYADDPRRTFQHDAPAPHETNDDTICSRSYHKPIIEDVEGEELSLEDLPEDVQQRSMPDDLAHELEIVETLGDEVWDMTIAEIESVIESRL